MMRWQWHQLDCMQIVCTSLQRDNHASITMRNFFYRWDALPDTKPAVSKYAHHLTLLQSLFLSCAEFLSVPFSHAAHIQLTGSCLD